VPCGPIGPPAPVNSGVRLFATNMSDSIYYHYTSIVGCAAIIQSKSAWLTDYRFLNDKHELTASLTSFLSHFTPEEQKSFQAALNAHSWSHHYCIFSLSKSPKILSQWRAYGDDARGAAIGFNAAFLGYAGLELAECQYENHDRYISDLAKKYKAIVGAAHVANMQRPSDIYGWARRKSAALRKIVTALIVLKNPAFAEEREVRGILSPPREKMLFRTRANDLLPYANVNLWEEGADDRARSLWVAAPEIWFGPKCSDLNKTALKLLCGGMSSFQEFDCGYV